MNAYVINLDKELYKWEIFQKNNKHYSNFFNFIRFPAIDIPENPIKGCFLSHLEVAKINKNNKFYIVFEDDCLIKPHNQQKLLKIFQFIMTNDWDIFNGNPNCPLTETNFTFNHPFAKIINVITGKSTNFLIVNNKIKLWEYEFTNIPFDKFLTTNFSLITHYPYITTQIPIYSSIQQKIVDYNPVFKQSEKYIAKLIKQKTVKVIFQGRLGNCLFQLFTALAHCLKNNLLLICSQENPQNYTSEVLNKLPFKQNIPKENIITESLMYSQITIPKNITSPSFNGYFQNIDNFKKYKHYFLKYLNLNPKKTPNVIGIHLRRTDYLIKTKTYEYYSFHQSYKKALKIMDNPQILIFTDDIDYCKREIKIPVEYFYGNEKESFETMMGLNYIILSNSTFSWMAAFLSSSIKKGFMPKKWLTSTNQNPGCPNENIIIEDY